MGLFSGLEQFGLKDVGGLNVYDDDSQKEESKKVEDKKVEEADFLFPKSHKCPVCETEFKSLAVKTGKLKAVGMDSDLRPRYEQLDPLKYDAIVCPKCGYAALTRYFDRIMSAQAKLVKSKISTNFKGINNDVLVYSYDDAIVRHKLALVCTIVKSGKVSERAYVCLKLAWVIRTKIEELEENGDGDVSQQIKQLHAEEQELLVNAYEGFFVAFSNESFPMCGMDEMTVVYLLADLAIKSGKIDESKRFISKILESKTANERIKNKARDLKEKVRNIN